MYYGYLWQKGKVGNTLKYVDGFHIKTMQLSSVSNFTKREKETDKVETKCFAVLRNTYLYLHLFV